MEIVKVNKSAEVFYRELVDKELKNLNFEVIQNVSMFGRIKNSYPLNIFNKINIILNRDENDI
jgi:hypothetical protein